MRRIEDLPSPQGAPFLGNVHQLHVKRLHSVIERWEEQLGSIFAFDVGSRRILVTSDPKLAQQALRERPESFRKLRSMTSVIDEMGFNGVFSAEGERWRPQRTLVTQALAKQGFPAFFPTLYEIVERLYRHWNRAASAGIVTDAVQDLTRFTVDVTSTLCFGQDINTLEQGDTPIQHHLEKIFPMVTRRTNLPVPYWRYFRLPKDRQLEQSITAVREFVREMIDTARQDLKRAPDRQPGNLLQAMIVAANDPGSGIDDDIIYANVVTLLLAGEDTTAHTLAWTLYCLAGRPAMQTRLQDSARACLGRHRIVPSYDATNNLGLFEATAFEAMRFKPTVPLIFLETRERIVLGDVILEPDTPVFLSLRAAMRDEANFDRPEHFNPQRWIGHREAGHLHNKRAFMQFGAGPRVCPGRHLAILEIRMALSMLSRNFSVELAAPSDSVAENFCFTMLPNALPLRLAHLA